MLLLIDNYDSFTHNLARYFRELGQCVKVVRNDQITCQDIAAIAPERLVISPGPGTPDQAGISLDAISTFAGRIPLLGVCLGHQAIAQAFGGNIVRAQHIRHGKTSAVIHNNHALFNAVSNPFTATRYHSLLVANQGLPADLHSIAWCEYPDQNREIMALAHKTQPIWGVQFHPESLLTVAGKQILDNFLRLSTVTSKNA